MEIFEKQLRAPAEGICASKTLQGTDDTIRFVYVGDGKWESEATLRILDETKYTLYVNIPGRETIWAETVSQPYRALGLHLMEEYLEYDEEKARESILRQPYCFGESDDSPVWIFAQEYTPEGWIDLDYLVTDNPFATSGSTAR